MTPIQIKNLRERLGLSQAALAERLGVTQQAVSLWEAGERKIHRPIAKLLKILEENKKEGI